MHTGMVPAPARVERAGPRDPHCLGYAAPANGQVGSLYTEREGRPGTREVDAHAGDDGLASVEAERHHCTSLSPHGSKYRSRSIRHATWATDALQLAQGEIAQ